MTMQNSKEKIILDPRLDVGRSGSRTLGNTSARLLDPLEACLPVAVKLAYVFPLPVHRGKSHLIVA
jgi:hypothetical protein